MRRRQHPDCRKLTISRQCGVQKLKSLAAHLMLSGHAGLLPAGFERLILVPRRLIRFVPGLPLGSQAFQCPVCFQQQQYRAAEAVAG